MADTRLLPPSLNDLRGRGFLACLDQVCALDLDRALLYWMDQAPPEALTALGWQFSLFGEGWETATTEAAQRNLILQAIPLHRRKGTPWAIKTALAAAGWPGLELEERLPSIVHDGTIRHDGSVRFNAGGRWAMFRVRQPIPADRGVTAADIDQVTAAINAWKPARCVLDAIRFEVPLAGTLAAGAVPAVAVFKAAGAEVFRRAVDQVTTAVGIVTVAAGLDQAEANGVGLDEFALEDAKGALLVTCKRAAITKTAALYLDCIWTLEEA
jgi:hypothetical protein